MTKTITICAACFQSAHTYRPDETGCQCSCHTGRAVWNDTDLNLFCTCCDDAPREARPRPEGERTMSEKPCSVCGCVPSDAWGCDCTNEDCPCSEPEDGDEDD